LALDIVIHGSDALLDHSSSPKPGLDRTKTLLSESGKELSVQVINQGAMGATTSSPASVGDWPELGEHAQAKAPISAGPILRETQRAFLAARLAMELVGRVRLIEPWTPATLRGSPNSLLARSY
jgi:hypothetical protein